MRRAMNRVSSRACCVALAGAGLLAGVARAEDAAPPADTATTKCHLQDVGTPQRSQDNAAHKVTFQGTIENSGDAVAKGARVRFQIRGAKDDFVVDDQAVPTEPPDIGPGEKAKFSVSASWTGVGAHGGGKEMLSREITSCEAPHEASPITGSGYCEIKFAGTPTTDSNGGTTTMRGELQNDGPGVASGIVVSISPATKDPKAKPPPSAKVTPETLAAGAKGKFELELPASSSPSEGSLAVSGYDCQPAPAPPAQ